METTIASTHPRYESQQLCLDSKCQSMDGLKAQFNYSTKTFIEPGLEGQYNPPHVY